MSTSSGKDELRTEVVGLFDRLKSGNSLASDFVDLTTVAFDVRLEWVDAMFRKPSLHDPDYVLFSHFRNPEDWLLDVGANRGYSVASMRTAGSRSRIMSFEVSEAFRASLARVKELEGDRYDFRIIGVARTKGKLKFYAPLVNGLAISALTTANIGGIDPSSFASNIISYIEDWIPPTDKYDVRLCTFEAEVDSLDALVPAGRRIAAVKLDIEGLEYQALEGARGLLGANRPFLLIEGGHRDQRIISFLAELGYQRAFRDEAVLRIGPTDANSLNGFFLHGERLKEYRDTGLLAG